MSSSVTTFSERCDLLGRLLKLFGAGMVGEKEYSELAHDMVRCDDSRFEKLKKVIASLESSRPIHVKIYPLMASIAEQYKGYGGAFKLYTFARGLDVSGSGQVKRNDLLTYIVALGMSEKTFNRWLAIALKIGIVKEYRGGDVLAYVNIAKAAFALGARNAIGYRLVNVEAKELASRKWNREVWKGHLATTRGRPITRAKLQEITAIAPSTQRRLDKLSFVLKIKNWHVYKSDEINEHPEASLNAFKEHKHGGAFIMRIKGGQKAIAARGPNTYFVGAFMLGLKGRSRKVNKAIRHFASLERYSGLSNMRQAKSYDVSQDDGQVTETAMPYLYHETEAQANIAQKIATQMENPPSCFYRLIKVSTKGAVIQNNFWTVAAYSEAK